MRSRDVQKKCCHIPDKSGSSYLIVSPPRCGKTTLLRDIIRQMSNGWGNISGVTVGVVDERSELAGCYQGIPQNDLGMRTDILDGCPKAEGMQMLIRSMSPVVVAVDELWKRRRFQGCGISYPLWMSSDRNCTWSFHGRNIIPAVFPEIVGSAGFPEIYFSGKA